MTYFYLLFVSFCVLASAIGHSDSGACNDGSSSCSANSDESTLLQSRLGAVGERSSDRVGDAIVNGVGVTANKTTDLQKIGGPVSPLISCGKTFRLIGQSAVWDGNCFCYKLVMCDTLYQHQPIEDCDANCEVTEKDWKPLPDFKAPLPGYWNTVIGKQPVTSADGLTQKYTGGTPGSCDTKDGKRETSLTMIVDNSKDKLSMVVTEPTERCSYHVQVTGPMKILGHATTTTTTTTVTDGPIPPSRSCGQTFYILGKSEVWDGNCFCYKLVMCDTLYQHQPIEDCNANCEVAEKDFKPDPNIRAPLPGYWNTVIGKFAADSEDGMTQSYTEGSRGSCDTEDSKRKTALTMVADNSKTDLNVLVHEPNHRCSYHAKVIGPISKLLGLQDKHKAKGR
jgi:hypothetical protein